MSDDWIEHRGNERPAELAAHGLVSYKLVGGQRAYVDWTSCLQWGHGPHRVAYYRLADGPDSTGRDKPSNPKDSLGVQKAPLSTVPMNVVAELGVAMLEGSAKYGRHNYRAVGVRTSVYFDAAMRHLVAFWEGEDIDPDSGMSHVVKAIATLVVLRDSQARGNWVDDRPPQSEAGLYSRLNTLSADVLARHADKSPKHYTASDQ